CIRTVLVSRAVDGVEFGAERAPAQCPQGFAPMTRIIQSLQKCVDSIRMPQRLWIARPVFSRPVQFPPVSGLVINRPLVKPGFGEQRRREALLRHRLEIRLSPMSAGFVMISEDLSVELLHHAEAAKLTLFPIPIAVVIAVLGCELAFRELVDH